MNARPRRLRSFVVALAGGGLAACTLTSDLTSLHSRPGSGGGSQGGAGGGEGAAAQGAGGGVAGGGGAGGGASREGFVRFANLMPILDVEQPEPTPDEPPPPPPVPGVGFAFDLCVRSSEAEPWRGPLLAYEGALPLGPAQMSDHAPLAAGPFEAKALPAGARDCDAPAAAELRGEVGGGEFLTLAVVGGTGGPPRLASYVDGRPSDGVEGPVEVAFINAFGEADFGLSIEPMGLLIEALGARQEFIEPGALRIEVYATSDPEALGFVPVEPLRIEPALGHSIFFFVARPDIQMVSAYVCQNGPGASVSPRVQPSSTCVLTELLPFGIPLPLPLPRRRPSPG
ncbi:MAG TPA: hypothetical protein VFS43_22620 [Polyangiaceae bacterium]|nr:hypothetical protein [Polyangiaceae bacterium]